MIFDTKMPGEFDGYVTCNYPVIHKACIQRRPHDPDNDDTPHIEIYSINWIMFLPNTIIDAKLGYFLYLELNLSEVDLRVFREIKDDYLKLVEFLLNRRFTKRHVIKACQNAIYEKVSLKTLGQVFNKINQLYKLYLILIADLSNQNLATSLNSSGEGSSGGTATGGSIVVDPASADTDNAQLKNLAIIDQYDMHNEILYPLVEGQDDTWWHANSKYTIAILIEYFRSLNAQHIPIEHLLYKLLVNALIKCNRQQQLHQYLQ
jgi:hypothetical protein